MNSDVLLAKSSRYTQGGLAYYNKAGKVKWWERYNVAPADDDIEVEVLPRFEHRPDRIAYEIYGKSEFAWIVLQTNHIVDIQEELLVGRVLTLPSPSRVLFDITNKKTGGELE